MVEIKHGDMMMMLRQMFSKKKKKKKTTKYLNSFYLKFLNVFEYRTSFETKLIEDKNSMIWFSDTMVVCFAIKEKARNDKNIIKIFSKVCSHKRKCFFQGYEKSGSFFDYPLKLPPFLFLNHQTKNPYSKGIFKKILFLFKNMKEKRNETLLGSFYVFWENKQLIIEIYLLLENFIMIGNKNDLFKTSSYKKLLSVFKKSNIIPTGFLEITKKEIETRGIFN